MERRLLLGWTPLLVIALAGTARGDEGHDATATTCSYSVSGGVMSHATWGATSGGACTVDFFEGTTTASGKVTALVIEASSPELRSVKVRLRFVRGPAGGVESPFTKGLGVFVGRAQIIGSDGVEWVAITRTQGDFRLELTSIRPDGLHGTVQVELPVSNLSPTIRNPLRLLTFRASF